MQIQTQSSLWSLGSVDLNEVGRSVIHLPLKGSNPGDVPLVVLVEVKLAEPSDHCSVVVVIWQATIETSTALAVRNDSDVHIVLQQCDIEFDKSSSRELFEVCVFPGQCVPFGWADSDGSTDVFVAVGTCLSGATRVVRVNFLKAGGVIKLPDNTGRVGVNEGLVLSVIAEGGGRVLHITRTQDPSTSFSTSFNASMSSLSLINSSKTTDSELDSKTFAVTFSLASFGVSLVVEKPVRREFFSLYIEGLEGRAKTKGAIRSFEFMVMDLQVKIY